MYVCIAVEENQLFLLICIWRMQNATFKKSPFKVLWLSSIRFKSSF